MEFRIGDIERREIESVVLEKLEGIEKGEFEVIVRLLILRIAISSDMFK